MIKVRFAEEKDLPDIDRLLNQVNLVHHEIRPDLFNIGRKYTDEQLEKIISDKNRPIFARENQRIRLKMKEREEDTHES